MRRKLTVHVDTQPWFVRPNNTDWRYMKTLKGMEKFIPVEFVYPDDAADSLGESFRYIRARLGLIPQAENENLVRKAKLRFGSKRPDVVLGHRRVPVDSDGVPYVWQYAVVDPVMQMSIGRQIADIDRQYAKVSEALGHASALQVSTDVEAARHRGIFSDVTRDIFAIPFFLPHVAAVSQVDLGRKHQDDKRLRVLFVGREGRRKGLDLIVGAMEMLSERVRQRIDLTIVCNFSDGFVKMPGGVNVTLIKTLPAADVQALMRSSHVFMMPSRFESFGFTLVEAMAAGCCVIGPDWEVQREILGEGTAGMNVEARMESVALALEQTLERNIRSGLATAAVDRFEAIYSATQVSKNYFDMFLSVS